MWFRRRREPGWMAILPNGRNIDVAHVAPGARPKVTLCESFTRTGDDADALRRLRRELRLDRYHCTTLLANGRYQIHQVEAPAVPDAELKSATRWRVKDLIDYPVDAAAVEVLDIPGDGSGSRARALFAVTAPNDAIDQCAAPWFDADVALTAIDVVELAQRNLCVLFESPPRAVALLAFHPDGALLTVTAGGELYLFRRVEVPIARLTEAGPEARAQQLERIALELQRSLDHFDRQYGSLTLEKLLVAPTPLADEIVATLATNLYVPVERCELGQVMDIAAVPALADGARQADCVAVLGAALRTAEVRT